MAIKGVSLAEREPYISTEDPGHEAHVDYLAAIENGNEPEKPTIFYIGNLTRAMRIEIGDMVTVPTMKDGGITLRNKNAEKAYKCVSYGLKGWDNMLDSEGKPVLFEEETAQVGSGYVKTVKESSLRHLSRDLLTELSNAILEKNGMLSELEKNLGGALPQPQDQTLTVGNAPIAQTDKKKKEAVQK